MSDEVPVIDDPDDPAKPERSAVLPRVQASRDRLAEIDELEKLTLSQAPDLIRDILWVYPRLHSKRTKPADAPHVGAWKMLGLAAKAPKWFLQNMLPKALTAQEKIANARAEKEKEKVAIDLGLDDIARLLREVDRDSPIESLTRENEQLKEELKKLSERYATLKNEVLEWRRNKQNRFYHKTPNIDDGDDRQDRIP